MHLLLDILFCKVPVAPKDSKPVKLLPITLNLSTCNTAWDGMLLLADKLTSASEERYNKLLFRLQWASKDAYSENKKKYRFFCCLPIWSWVVVNFMTFLFLLYETNYRIKYSDDSFSYESLASKLASNKTSKASHEKSQNSQMTWNNLYLGTFIFSIICFVISILVLIVVTVIPLKNLIQGRKKLNSLRNVYYTDQQPEKNLFMNELPNIMRFCNPSSASTVNETLHWSGHNSLNSRGQKRIYTSSRCSQKDLESAATLAAAAAAAAVTASKYQNHTYQLRNSSPVSTSSSIDIHQEFEAVNRSFANQPIARTPTKKKKKRRKVERRKQKSKKSFDEDGKAYSGDDFNDDAVNECLIDSDFEADNYRKKRLSNLTSEEISLRYYLMRTCGVLHRLDARLGDRQTRIIICVDSTSTNNGISVSQTKLANFVRLLDRLLMSTTPLSNSGEVPVLLNSPNCRGNKILSTSWTPSVVVLLLANETTPWKPLGNFNGSVTQLPIMNPASTTGYSGFSEAWRYIHQTCHLPVYLEEAPPGPDEMSFYQWCQKNSVSSIEEYLTKSKNSNSLSRKHSRTKSDQSLIDANSEKIKSIIDIFIEQNELHDLNAKKLRHLLTLTEFMGRMMRLNQLIQPQRIMNSPTSNSYDGLDRFNNGTSWPLDSLPINAVSTWLSICVHWPFLTSWLVLFLEEHWSTSTKDEDVLSFDTTLEGFDDAKSHASQEGRRRKLDDFDVPSSQPVYPTDRVSDLYTRVLAKLSNGVRSSRHHLNSSSLGNVSVHSNSSNQYQSSMSKILYEMSLRDMDPTRLENYLCRKKDGGNYSDRRHSNPCGNLRAAHMVQVMANSPFLNPQIRRWIREILRTKGFTVSKSLAKDRESAREALNVSRKSMNLAGRPEKMDEYFEEEFNRAISSRLNLTEGIVKLKNGYPKKLLSHMTVNEICQLVNEIEGLARDSTTNAVNLSLLMFYEARIRQLNLSGTVLAVCNLNDLRAEMEMSFGDWHLFSSLISYLKTLELRMREGRRRRNSTVSLNEEISELIPITVKIPNVKSNLDLYQRSSDKTSKQIGFVLESDQQFHQKSCDVYAGSDSPCNCEYWYSIETRNPDPLDKINERFFSNKTPQENTKHDQSCSPKSNEESLDSEEESMTCNSDTGKSSICSMNDDFENDISVQISPNVLEPLTSNQQSSLISLENSIVQ